MTSISHKHFTPAAPEDSGYTWSTAGQERLPAWWRAGRARYEGLRRIERELGEHKGDMSRKSRTMLFGSISALVAIYSADAAGAMPVLLGPNVLLPASICLLIAVVAWMFDVRLRGQIRDMELLVRHWLDLVEAARQGCVERALLDEAEPSESEIDRRLRKELAAAADFVAAQEGVEPYLPLVGPSFALRKLDTGLLS